VPAVARAALPNFDISGALIYMISIYYAFIDHLLGGSGSLQHCVVLGQAIYVAGNLALLVVGSAMMNTVADIYVSDELTVTAVDTNCCSKNSLKVSLTAHTLRFFRG
jgi:hypothetical protein